MSLSRPAEGWICSLQALTTLSTVERGFFGKSLQILSTTCSISQSCQEPVSRFREGFKKSSRIGVGICNQLRGPKSSGSGRNLPFKAEGPRSAARFEARWREIIACWHSRHAMRLTRPAPESYQTAKPGLMPPLLLMPQAKDRANSLGAADQDGPSSFDAIADFSRPLSAA